MPTQTKTRITKVRKPDFDSSLMYRPEYHFSAQPDTFWLPIGESNRDIFIVPNSKHDIGLTHAIIASLGTLLTEFVGGYDTFHSVEGHPIEYQFGCIDVWNNYRTSWFFRKLETLIPAPKYGGRLWLHHNPETRGENIGYIAYASRDQSDPEYTPRVYAKKRPEKHTENPVTVLEDEDEAACSTDVPAPVDPIKTRLDAMVLSAAYSSHWVDFDYAVTTMKTKIAAVQAEFPKTDRRRVGGLIACGSLGFELVDQFTTDRPIPRHRNHRLTLSKHAIDRGIESARIALLND